MRVAPIIAMIASGCIKAAAFECTSDPQCTRAGLQGTCEQVGFCSFPDTTCATGRRFGDVSGKHTQQCVGDAGFGRDAAVDGIIQVPDGLGCPVGYATLTGLPNHVYRRIATMDSWDHQVAACRADGANVYLAIPDNATELSGILTFASTNVWIGVDDIATENRFVTVLETAATFLPWTAGQPDNSGGGEGSDCVMALSTSATYDDRRCSTAEIAVCECEP
jgi:hypothetical protein